MFCPECGQQQLSNEVRFCSRCGFQLGGVTGLLATRGAVPAGLVAADSSSESPKRKGVRQGAKLLLFGVFLMPFFGLLSEMTRELVPVELVIVGVITFLAGLLRLIYAALFEDGPYRKTIVPASYVQPGAFAQGATPAHAPELPPAQSVPARAYAPPRHDTAEIGYRPSVTEHETQLLDEKRDDPAR
jgi:hypothetical protein